MKHRWFARWDNEGLSYTTHSVRRIDAPRKLEFKIFVNLRLDASLIVWSPWSSRSPTRPISALT